MVDVRMDNMLESNTCVRIGSTIFASPDIMLELLSVIFTIEERKDMVKSFFKHYGASFSSCYIARKYVIKQLDKRLKNLK